MRSAGFLYGPRLGNAKLYTELATSGVVSKLHIHFSARFLIFLLTIMRRSSYRSMGTILDR
jgi:hypothetical protein